MLDEIVANTPAGEVELRLYVDCMETRTATQLHTGNLN